MTADREELVRALDTLYELSVDKTVDFEDKMPVIESYFLSIKWETQWARELMAEIVKLTKKWIGMTNDKRRKSPYSLLDQIIIMIRKAVDTHE